MPDGDKSKIWTGSCYPKVFEFPAMKSGYGEFCPIAKASEVFATRWTPLVLRELMLGAHSFNDIHRGVPLMSRTLSGRAPAAIGRKRNHRKKNPP